MNYTKVNKALFILFNITWSIVVLPLSLYYLSLEDPFFQWENIRWLLLTLIFVAVQVVGYYKLREGNIYYAAAAVILLSFIIDIDGFKLFNTLLLNVDMLYATGGEFIFEIRFLDGPSINWNVRLTDFKFNQIGFNTVGFIQLFFLLDQETFKDSTADNDLLED